MIQAASSLESPLVEFLEQRLPGPLFESTLRGPLREFLARPGKLLRARLVELSWELAGGRGSPPAALPLSVELLHAGSLIIDDIEDCAEERRGAPALHRRAGLPLALNAGNWLYFAALEQVGALPLDERRLLRVLRRTHALLARCHEGQALDVGVRVSQVPQREVGELVRAISERKTGGLAALCTSLAALCAGAPPAAEAALCDFGVALGVGLQLLDDTSGLCGEGRRAKGEEDLRNGRATWGWALVAEGASPSRYRALQRHAAQVEQGRKPASPLGAELRSLLGEQGQARAHALLDSALSALAFALGPSSSLDGATALVRALEQGYG